MTTLREAAQQALEALEEYQSKGAPFMSCDAAVAALRATLAEPLDDIEALRLDAERYRWLRDQTTHDGCVISMKNKHIDDEIGYAENIDRFVDAAMKEAALAEPVEPTPIPTFPPVSQWKQGCAVCGIGADGKAYGYVCSRWDCPIKITCGGAV